MNLKMDACRICLADNDLVNMRNEIKEKRSLYSIFVEFSGIKIPAAQTTLICPTCSKFLYAFCNLKRQTVDNSLLFMNYCIKEEVEDDEYVDGEVNIVFQTKEDELDPIYQMTIQKTDEVDNEDQLNETPNASHEEDDVKEILYDSDETPIETEVEVTELPAQKEEPMVIQLQPQGLRPRKRPEYEKSGYWCSYCFQTFISKTELVKHRNEEIIANGGMECDLCGRKQNIRRHFIGHMRTVHLKDRTKRYPCDMCDKTFSQKGQILGHKRQEHFKLRVICHICSKEFKHKNALDHHVKHFHEKQRPEICPQCDRGFSTKAQLRVHIVQKHTNLKPYSCTHCDKRFSSLSSKITHEKIHGSQLVKCDQCDFVTNTTYNLKSHMIRHQEVYRYSCNICSQQFKCHSSLRMHQYSHKERSFECEYCHKKYSRPGGLKIHIDSVHLNKRHKCNVCDEEFSSLKVVRHHFKIQHGGLRFFCKCGKFFDRKTFYKKHGKVCDYAAYNEPEVKSIFPDAPPVNRKVGRPGKFTLNGPVETLE